MSNVSFNRNFRVFSMKDNHGANLIRVIVNLIIFLVITNKISVFIGFKRSE